MMSSGADPNSWGQSLHMSKFLIFLKNYFVVTKHFKNMFFVIFDPKIYTWTIFGIAGAFSAGLQNKGIFGLYIRVARFFSLRNTLVCNGFR